MPKKIKLQDIRVSRYKYQHKIEYNTFKDNNIWPVKRILEEVFFHCEVDDRLKLKEIIDQRKNGRREYDAYIKVIEKDLVLVSDDELQAHKAVFEDVENYLIQDNIIVKKHRDFMRVIGGFYNIFYYLGFDFDEDDLYNIGELQLTLEENKKVVKLILENRNAFIQMPSKTNDSNSSKKGIVSQKFYRAKLNEELLKIMINHFNFSKHRAKSILQIIINIASR